MVFASKFNVLETQHKRKLITHNYQANGGKPSRLPGLWQRSWKFSPSCTENQNKPFRFNDVIPTSPYETSGRENREPICCNAVRLNEFCGSAGANFQDSCPMPGTPG